MTAARARLTCVAVAAGALVALATTGEAGASTIHACVKPKSGATRIVSAKARCRRGEKRLSWSTTGPPGKTGPAGPGGPAGTEGKAGPSGVGPVYSVSHAEPVTLGSESIVLTKTVPPGSYWVSAKTVVGEETKTAGTVTFICAVQITPGTIASTKAPDLDVSGFATALAESGGATEWSTAQTVPLSGAFSSPVTNTLSLGCAALGGPAGKPFADESQLQAVVVSSVL